MVRPVNAICCGGIMPFSFAMCVRRFVIADSNSFPMEHKSAIGLQFFGFENGRDVFRRHMVVAVLN